VRHVETTVTRDNQASRAMFDSLARKLDCGITEELMFDRQKHFLNLHDSEYRLRIGPFDNSKAGQQGETS